MTLKEQKIRLFWLLTLAVPQLIGVIYSFCFPAENVTTFPLIIGTVIGLLFLWMMIYCAYKKPGTKLLTFFVWTWPFFVLMTLLYHYIYKLEMRTIDLALLPSHCVWYYLTIQLRKINKKLKTA